MNNKKLSPIEKRYCACNCGIEFQPGRKDQIYLNRLHANFAYNHGIRKENIGRAPTIEKLLRSNDKILARAFSKGIRSIYECPKSEIAIKGFDFGLFTGRSKEGFFLMYNYGYKILCRDNETFILITRI